jgi:hypothetical protein
MYVCDEIAIWLVKLAKKSIGLAHCKWADNHLLIPRGISCYCYLTHKKGHELLLWVWFGKYFFLQEKRKRNELRWYKAKKSFKFFISEKKKLFINVKKWVWLCKCTWPHIYIIYPLNEKKKKNWYSDVHRNIFSLCFKP